ncbi:hypothetical protein [Chitinophaga agri]|uniref:Uncharacterized protein n=1 Tax=Chitinophaga agri TaxID=2703787 RepID=A0A6B9ZAJ0_9BACT|nr:hypothetical protein [Chitinophaga agri]QHS58829.1 hypothetical protein GWR21_04185 [Chitinophaga agri]
MKWSNHCSCHLTDRPVKANSWIMGDIWYIEHEYLRGGCKHLFTYQNGGFYLIGASSNTGDPTFNQSFEYNLSTGKYIAEYRNYETDKKASTEATHKPAKLPRIESYKLFSLEVNGESL